MNNLIRTQDGLAKLDSAIKLANKLLDYNNELPDLIPFRKGSKWGFCDKNKEIIIPVKYDDVELFEFGLAKVKLNNNYGIINKNGEELVPIDYHNLKIINSNLGAIMLDRRWGLIDCKNQMLVEYIYTDIHKLSNKLILVKMDGWKGKWGIVDETGDNVVEFKYDEIRKQSTKMCAVSKGSTWGFVDCFGNEIITCKYDDVGTFNEGLCPVKLGHKWGFIDELDNMIINPEYDKTEDFSEGLCQVRSGERWGFIDKYNRLIIGYNYKWGGSRFKDGHAVVWKDTGRLGSRKVINNIGYEIDKFEQYDNNIVIYSEGSALVTLTEKNELNSGIRMLEVKGIIDRSGKIIIPCIYYENTIKDFSKGLTLVGYYYSHIDFGGVSYNWYFDRIGYISESGDEYWDDGNDPQFYIDKYNIRKERDKHHYDYMIYLCSKAISMDPCFSKAYFNRGLATMRELNFIDFKAAIYDFEMVLKFDPENYECYYLLGNARFGDLDYSGAIKAFSEALKYNLDDSYAYLERGKAKRLNSDVSGAIDDFTSYLDMNNLSKLQRIHGYIQRGLSKLLIGDFIGAIADYDSVLELDSSYEAAYILRGDARKNLGDPFFVEDWKHLDEMRIKNKLSLGITYIEHVEVEALISRLNQPSHGYNLDNKYQFRM